MRFDQPEIPTLFEDGNTKTRSTDFTEQSELAPWHTYGMNATVLSIGHTN